MMARYPYLSPFTAVGQDDHRIVKESLARTDATEFADRLMDTLSGGESQRLKLVPERNAGDRYLLDPEMSTFLEVLKSDANQPVARLIR